MTTPELLLVGTTAGLSVYLRERRGTLRLLRHVLVGVAVRAIAAADAELLVVNADGAARQTFDGGISWSAAAGVVPDPPGLQVVTVRGPAAVGYPRLAGATAYARLRTRPPALIGAGAGGMLLFRSEDDGIHWKPADMPPAPAGNVTTLAPAPARVAAAWAGTDTGALLESIDGGLSWVDRACAAAPVLCLAAVAAPDQEGD